MPSSPPVYRRGISREDGDVFSRLGAGMSDPTPGGSIKEFNGRVKLLLFQISHLKFSLFRLDESWVASFVYSYR